MDAASGSLGGRRGEFEITLSVLRLVNQGEGRTRIMYGANVSHAMLRRYLDGLVRLGFVARDGERYRLTERGMALKRDMERVALHFAEPPTGLEALPPRATGRT